MGLKSRNSTVVRRTLTYILFKKIVQELYDGPYLCVGLGKRRNALGKNEFDVSHQYRMLILVSSFQFCAVFC